MYKQLSIVPKHPNSCLTHSPTRTHTPLCTHTGSLSHGDFCTQYPVNTLDRKEIPLHTVAGSLRAVLALSSAGCSWSPGELGRTLHCIAWPGLGRDGVPWGQCWWWQTPMMAVASSLASFPSVTHVLPPAPPTPPYTSLQTAIWISQNCLVNPLIAV